MKQRPHRAQPRGPLRPQPPAPAATSRPYRPRARSARRIRFFFIVPHFEMSDTFQMTTLPFFSTTATRCFPGEIRVTFPTFSPFLTRSPTFTRLTLSNPQGGRYVSTSSFSAMISTATAARCIRHRKCVPGRFGRNLHRANGQRTRQVRRADCRGQSVFGRRRIARRCSRRDVCGHRRQRRKQILRSHNPLRPS